MDNNRTAIQKIAGTYGKDIALIVSGKVNSVNVAARTCNITPIKHNMAAFDAFLMAEVDDGMLIVPAVESTVHVVITQHIRPMVIQFSEISEVLLISGNQSYNLKDGLQQFNDGAYGGLVRVIELTKKLNNLENIVTDLISKFNTHTHTGVTTGPGATGPTATPETGSITLTQRADIENTSVTHGKNLS